MSDPINDLKGKLITIHIDRAMSSCLEMMSELLYMRTLGSEENDGRDQLIDRLDEIVDLFMSMIHELKQVNAMI